MSLLSMRHLTVVVNETFDSLLSMRHLTVVVNETFDRRCWQ